MEQQNQLQTFENKEVSFQAGGEEVKLTAGTVRNYLVSGNEVVSDQEVAMFINLCKYQHLNPFLNEAYLIKFKGRPAQIITSKEAFMKRAESNPHYRGSKAGVIVFRNSEIVYMNGAFTLPNDQIVGGWAEVKRDDRDEPVHVEISIKEFGKGQATWKAMPANMIRKTALVNALREAFPDSLGSLYTEDDKHDFSQPRQVDADVQETPTKATESTAELLADFKASKEQEKEQPKPIEPVEEDSDQMGLFEATGDVD